MVKCMIVDDEPIAVRVIKKHLAAFNGFEIVAECSSALEAMPILAKQKIDLLFCDIQMPQITGLDFVRALKHPPKVIFTTAYRDYAIDAFELNVVDYLLKPISFERFAKAIQHFMEQDAVSPGQGEQHEAEAQKSRNYIFLKADKKHHKVNLNDIFYFESMGDYVVVFTQQKKIVTKERIGNLPEMLPEDKFLQIHRRYVVSIPKIESVGPGFVEISGKKLPVGRNYKPELSRFLQNE